MSRPMWKIALAGLVAVSTLACNQNQENQPATGSADVQVTALSTTDVNRVTLTIEGSSLAYPRTVPIYASGASGATWQSLVGQIPVGADYVFSISATDTTGVELYRGSASPISILSGQTTKVVIVAQQVKASTPFVDSVPVIQKLTVSSTLVAPNTAVSLQVVATDPDGDALTYAWTAGGGSFTNAAATSTTWASSSNGAFVITVTVTDTHGLSASAQVTVTVSDSAATGGSNVIVALNTSPVATNLVATPGYFVAGSATTLTATATDADGDVLSYAWTSSCAGSFAGTGATATFTLSASETATSCTVHVVISDGRGGQTTSDLTVGVGQPIVNSAPVILISSQSDSSAYFGRSVSLYVQAQDPEASALTFQWSTTAGALSGQGDGSDNSSITFTAPSNSDAVWTVTVSVRDALGATTTLDFPIVSLGPTDVEFVFTSDAHYGLTKATFRGASKVSAQVVNQAMVAQINTMASVVLPSDSGVHAGLPVGAVDFVIEGGDVANRMELASSVQTDAVSWSQYTNDYIHGLTLTNHAGVLAPLVTIPGNHDVSNAIGYWKTMSPLIDATSMVAIFNAAMNPAVPRTTDTYNYSTDKVHFSKTFGGVHFAFINMWPDSVERAWLSSDIASLDATTPVIVFCHDQPDVETKHLKNPNGDHSINATDQFENMTEDFSSVTTISQPSTVEQRALVAYLKANKNIVAYFHGNSHIQEMINWTGPDADISLPVFSVDSPMKGTVSSTDETKLAFNLGSIDVINKQMTVREVRWNSTKSASSPITFATYKTVSLVVPQ